MRRIDHRVTVLQPRLEVEERVLAGLHAARRPAKLSSAGLAGSGHDGSWSLGQQLRGARCAPRRARGLTQAAASRPERVLKPPGRVEVGCVSAHLCSSGRDPSQASSCEGPRARSGAQSSEQRDQEEVTIVVACERRRCRVAEDEDLGAHKRQQHAGGEEGSRIVNSARPRDRSNGTADDVFRGSSCMSDSSALRISRTETRLALQRPTVGEVPVEQSRERRKPGGEHPVATTPPPPPPHKQAARRPPTRRRRRSSRLNG